MLQTYYKFHCAGRRHGHEHTALKLQISWYDQSFKIKENISELSYNQNLLMSEKDLTKIKLM